MLSEQTALTENLSTDSVPIRFITTDDGRTLLAVSEQNNSMLEIMATPVTFVQQHDTVSPTFIKTADGNFILHSPIFQISVESISENGMQQAAMLPVHTVDTPIIVEDNITVAEKDLQIESTNCLPITVVTENSIPLEKDSQSFVPEISVDTAASKSRVIRSPGRPKKSATTERVATDLKCDICGQTFLKQTQFRKHMEHHAEEKPHRCPKCPASFNVPTNFTLHMATHNTGEPKCPECGRKFARMASLKSHMLLHEKEENLFCTECEDAFLTRAQLEAHQKLHGEKWSTEDVRKCKLCNKQFVQPALYRLHIREHYRLQTKMVKQTKRGTKHKTMYKCTICLKSFQKPSQLMRHIRVHTGEKPFKCNTCGRAFTQKSSLQIHVWQHKGIRPHACNLCNAKFSQKGNLNAHILRVHNALEGEPIYGCTHCSCVFKKLGSLNGHMKRMHSNPVEEVTPRCDSSIEADMRATVDSVISQLASLESGANEIVQLTNASSMNTNKNDILQQALKNSGLQSKNKNLTDELSEANKNSGTRISYVTLLDRGPDGTMRKYLTIKQRCMGSVRWYACSSCHKEFKKPSDLIRHIRVHTQEKPFKCSYCYRSFALKSTMIAHERTHIGTKKYACGSCDKTFACHSSLTAHTRLHIKPHKCTICDKSFCAIAMLKNHMKSHSKGKSKLSPEAEVLVPQIVLQEPLVISDAGNKISVAHIQSKQGQGYDNENVSRPHKCWVCQAAFRKVSHFKQHYRRHTGERPYKCTKCERRFTSNSVLKSHLHTHDETRPYSCSICSTKFSTQSSMKRHLVTHSNKRPFMCPYCHKTFKTSVNCRKHMKIHKHELAQQQLEHQQTRNQSPEDTLIQHKETISSLSDNIVLPDDMEVSFQPQMAPDFAEAFSDQFQSITDEKEKSFLSSDNAGQSIVNSNMAEVNTTNLESSQTLHADETGTITLPNYSGDQTLTAESIREIEETLNQQLFSIGMNFGLGNNLAKHMDETSTSPLETREQPVLNIIYENNKNIETSGNPIFTSHFDSFDMSQISLQPDSEIDMGLNTPTSTSMSSILPRSTQEQQPISVESNNVGDDDQVKISSQLMVVNSEQSFSELSNLVQICTKFPKIIAKADTTGGSELMSTSDNIKDDGIDSCETEKLSSSLTCHLCNKTFRDSTQLKTHIKMHTTSNIIYSNDDGTMIDMPEHNSLLQCHMCNERGFTAASLKEHLKKHRGTKEYQCPECALRFCTNGGLSRHLKMHTNKQQWKCSICHKILSSRVQLKLHNKIHDNNWNASSTEPDSSQRDVVTINANLTRIGTSDGKLSSDSSVSEKVLLDTVAEREIMDRIDSQMEKKETKEYTNKCKYCPKTFRKPSDLIRHIRTHTGERPYKCNYCSKSFAVKCTLDSHTKVHTGKKTFCCHVCNSLFATKGSLKVHMRLHTGSKPFRCTVCDLRFRTSGHRKVHMLKHAREHKGSPKRKQKHFKAAAIAEVAAGLEKSVEATPQTALIDDIRNVNYTNLETIGIEAAGLTNQITFNADGTILNNNSILTMNESNQLVANLHFMLANGLFTIQADDTLISQPSHCDLNVTPDATAVNEIVTSTLEVPCSNTNSNNIVITSQVPTDNTTSQANHTMLNLNNCISMMQVDRRNDTIKPEQSIARQANKGTQSKKECDICGKTFRKPYQVERHKRIHTGERPYKCDLCTKSFAQKSTLQMHQKHHTGDRPHPCPHCEHSFTQKCNLQTHLRRVHQLGAPEAKKVRRGQQILSAKLTQDTLADAKILNLDDISFVELLK